MYTLNRAGVIWPCFFFFFNDTATTEIYTLSLHDALPIYRPRSPGFRLGRQPEPRDRSDARRLRCRGGLAAAECPAQHRQRRDRKSTRLNSSHSQISYAVFCLKKKKTILSHIPQPSMHNRRTTITPR